MALKQVTIYTDGACSGNPGPGGWGADFPQKTLSFAGALFPFDLSPGGNEFRLGSAPFGARAGARGERPPGRSV